MVIMAKKKPKPEALPDGGMTGEQFAAARAALGLSQSGLAKELGVATRTVVRLESSAMLSAPVPLTHAKHVRCIAAVRGVSLP